MCQFLWSELGAGTRKREPEALPGALPVYTKPVHYLAELVLRDECLHVQWPRCHLPKYIWDRWRAALVYITPGYKYSPLTSI